MHEIKRINPWAFARTLALVFTLVAIVAVFVGPMTILFLSEGSMREAYSLTFRKDSVFFMSYVTFIVAISSIIGGFIVAWAYNFIASKVGGLKLEIKEVAEKKE